MNRKNRSKSTVKRELLETITHPDAAGIDVGAEELVVAVAPDRDAEPVRTFDSFTSSLHRMRDWLLQCMQKALTEMNLKLHHVLSDLDSVSGLAILDAILAGERDPRRLAALRDKRCKAPLATVMAALEGDYREEYLFVLRQCRQSWGRLQGDILEVDGQLTRMLGKVGPATAEQALPKAANARQHRALKNSPALPIFQEGWRFFGVDLSSIDGVSSGLISTLMSELGDANHIRRAFGSGSIFCSWLGLCPDNRISGGKVLKAKTRHVVHRVATAFRLCAQALSHTKGALGDYCRRMKGRLGKAEGITATAHKLARIVYAMLGSKQPYDEATAFQATPATQAKRLASLKKRAQKLGFELVAIPLPT